MAIGGSKTTDPKDSVYEFVDQLNKVDLSGNSNNASNAGATWQTSVKKFYGGAAATNTKRRAMQITSDDFNVGTGDFTLSFGLIPHPQPKKVAYGLVLFQLELTLQHLFKSGISDLRQVVFVTHTLTIVNTLLVQMLTSEISGCMWQ